MNILDFINSKAIRKHLKDMDYKFNPVEMSWLIYQSQNCSIEEKKAAFEEIIASYPDCDIFENNKVNLVTIDYQGLSLHTFLKQYMDETDACINLFYNPGDKAIYSFRCYCSGDYSYIEEHDELFSNVEDCWEGIMEYMKYDPLVIEIKLRWLSVQNKYLILTFDKNKRLMDIYDYHEPYQPLSHVFDAMYFEFPVPFEVGDIVYMPTVYRFSEREENYPFVLRCPINNISYPINGLYPDSSDMCIAGYFQNQQGGEMYYEVTHNYMDLEYYEGEFKGVHRFMKALSSYIKGKIDLQMLLCAYKQIILQDDVDDVMMTNWFPKGYLRDCGFEI